MKRLLLLLFCLINLPVNAITIDDIFTSDKGVLIYHIPDDEPENTTETKTEIKTETKTDIISDDITADTSGTTAEITELEEDEDYEISDMYACVLKGYAQYNEEEENAIPLVLKDNEIAVILLKKPAPVEGKFFGSLKPSDSLFDNIYTMYNGSEYNIAPISGKTSRELGGGFSAGTTYSQGIDYGELEQSSGIYTKYQYKKFALSTSYLKTVNSTNNNYNDNFYIIPELKLNQYITLKNILSADTTKKRKKAEIVISINPLGNKDIDRILFEFGANGTYDETNNVLKNQFKFTTNFRF